MRMAPIDAVDVPAGGSAMLEPGGKHVMLIGLQKELATGDTFELTLNFEKSGSQTIQVEVQQGLAMDHTMEEGQTDHAMAEGETEQDMDHAVEEAEMDADPQEGQMDHAMEEAGTEHDMEEAGTEHGDEAGATTEHSHDEEHAASTAVVMQPQVFKVVAVAYLMDTAGFHGMDERLNDGGQIEAGDAGTVNRVGSVLAAIDWPDELKAQAEELQATLAEYAEALSNDDVEAAKPLATQAHEQQHGLSHAIGGWPGEIEGVSGPEQNFQIVTAAHLMDTAGFHGMDERLNDGGQIEGGDAGVVNRVGRVLAVTDWPDELKAQAEELQATLAEYAEALSDDDVEAAKPLATQAHEQQHELSHALESWVADHAMAGEHAMAAGETDQRFQASVAAYLMDTAGFHGMDERLNDGGQIEGGDAGVVNRVGRVVAVVDWPEDLKAQAEAFQTVLTQYAEALSNDDVEAAKPLATQTHEQQHDLSHAIAGWLSGDSEHGQEHDHDETGSSEHGETGESN
jgi:hypothetical protein